MTTPTAYDLANDHTFRHLLGAGSPPQPARITAVNANDYTLDSLIGDGDLTGVALNGWAYGEGDLVYVLLAAGEGDNAVILGALTADDTKLAIGDATTPDGPLTARGSAGRFFFREAAVDGTETTLIAAGQIGSAAFYFVGADNGTAIAYTTYGLQVPGSSYNSHNLTVGADTVQIRLYSTGALTAIRTAGSNSVNLVITVMGAG